MAAKSSAVSHKERYINRYRGRFTTGANATTVVTESFNTGMNIGQANPYKWVITHFAWWPNKATYASPWGAAQAACVQLLLGNQSALLEADDAQVVCEAKAVCAYATNGGVGFNMPIVGFLPSPIPIFSQALTVAYAAATNDTALQSKEIAYEIGYVTAPIEQSEILEFLAAMGQV